MAYITTATDVATGLKVMKSVNGQIMPSYPKRHSLLNVFSSQQEITEYEWQKMAGTPRTQRINAFIAHVNAAEAINVRNTQINTEFRPSEETPGVVVEW